MNINKRVCFQCSGNKPDEENEDDDSKENEDDDSNENDGDDSNENDGDDSKDHQDSDYDEYEEWHLANQSDGTNQDSAMGVTPQKEK